MVPPLFIISICCHLSLHGKFSCPHWNYNLTGLELERWAAPGRFMLGPKLASRGFHHCDCEHCWLSLMIISLIVMIQVTLVSSYPDIPLEPVGQWRRDDHDHGSHENYEIIQMSSIFIHNSPQHDSWSSNHWCHPQTELQIWKVDAGWGGWLCLPFSPPMGRGRFLNFFYHCRDNIRKFIKVFKFFLPCFEQFFRLPMFAKMILFTPGCCSPTGSQERNPVSLNFSVCWIR